MFEYIKEGIECFLHFDGCLQSLVVKYDTMIYLILCAILFCETGLIVTPFLPGDSLLYATGLLAGQSGNPLNIYLVAILLTASAFSGDNVNFTIGKFFGKRIYDKNYRIIKQQYIDKTHDYYQKHGAITIIFGKFMPFIRTFSPFVAGIGQMDYSKFLKNSIIGNLLWINLFVWIGYFSNKIPLIKNNYETAILVILGLTLIPPIISLTKSLIKKYKNKSVQ